jgi:ribosomal protein S18 acetylase RimI-like enzyme
MEIKRLKKGELEIAEATFRQFGQDPGVQSHSPFAKHLEGLLSNPTCYLLAAVDDNVIVGFTLAYRFPSFYESKQTAYLYDIEVLPNERQKGIGRRLIEELLIQLKKDNVSEIWLGTALENIPAQKLFNSTGALKEEEIFQEYIYYIS